MENKYNRVYNEFQYVEFIRNPVIQRNNVELNNIKCVALDYFDFIYAKEVSSFAECMVSENGIPCEAYQSIGLFRKKDDSEDSNSPFDLDSKTPFLSILQVTYNPAAFFLRKDNFFSEREKDVEQLEVLINEAKDDYLKKFIDDKAFDKEKFKLKFRVYNTVNPTDYCIVFSTNYLDFSIFLSNTVRQQRVEKEQKSYLKYAVYTVVGISYKFNYLPDNEHRCMSEDTVMVTRVHLSEKFFEGNDTRFEEIIKNEHQETTVGIITDTHTLPGRYDLSIRLNGYKHVVSLLPFVIENIMCKFFPDWKNTDDSSKEIEDNVIKFLTETGNAEYMNVRMFFNCEDNLNLMNSSKALDFHDNSINVKSSSVLSLFEDVKNNLSSLNMSGYAEKLHNIVHIYIALYSRYDTNISMKMLGSYLKDFFSLLKLNISFVKENKVNIEDFKMNLVSGINYFQKYIEIVMSVNGSSFEAPKYEVEKDECCVAKLPIAYINFLNNIFTDYYENRRENNDEEFVYFPKYKPLVIPYMHTIQDAQSDYMMTTLFAQDMSDDWVYVRTKWEEFVRNNNVPMYIICQDMDKYKDVSSMIISSFHELGHYCNGMNRRQRNSDFVKIYIDEISVSVVKKIISMSDTSYQIKNLALTLSPVFQHLKSCVYESLVNFMLGTNGLLQEFIDYPSIVFKEKFNDVIRNIFDVYVDCNSKNLLSQQLSDSYLKEYYFVFGRSYDHSFNESNETELVCFIVRDCIDRFNDCVNTVVLNINELDDSFIKNILIDLTKVLNQIKELFGNSELENDKLIDYLLFHDSVNDYIKEIYELYKKIKTISKIRNDKNEEKLYKIREDLNFAVTCLLFYMNTVRKYSMVYFNNNKLIWIDRDELQETVKRKKCIIDNIVESYLDFSQKHLDCFCNKDSFFNGIYHQLELNPDGDVDNLKKIINTSLKGLNIPIDKMELSQSCYEESIADIVMCLNLNLSLEEYLLDMSDLYLDIKDSYNLQTVARLIIVSSYILFSEHFDGEYRARDVQVLYKNIQDDFIDKFKDEMSRFYSQDYLEKLLELIINNCSGIIETKLFEVALKRVYESISMMRIVKYNTKYDISFVKDSIRIKYSDSQDSNTEKLKSELQNSEIEFIQKHYYQNRIIYSD